MIRRVVPGRKLLIATAGVATLTFGACETSVSNVAVDGEHTNEAGVANVAVPGDGDAGDTSPKDSGSQDAAVEAGDDASSDDGGADAADGNG